MLNPDKIRGDLSAQEIQDQIVARMAESLKVSPEAVDVHGRFDASGLDSLQIVSLIGELEDFLGRTVPDRAIVEHPSIAKLAAYLASPSATLPQQSGWESD